MITSPTKTKAKTWTNTKIAFTFDEQDNVESLMELFNAGISIIRVNIAYVSKNVLKSLCASRDQLEQELKIKIPIMIDLKGDEVRVRLNSATQIELQEGSEVYIVNRRNAFKGLPMEKYCIYVDGESFFEECEEGDDILISTTQHVFSVQKILKFMNIKAAENNMYPPHSNSFPNLLSRDTNSLASDSLPSLIPETKGETQKELKNYKALNRRLLYESCLQKEKAACKEAFFCIKCYVEKNCLIKSGMPLFLWKKSSQSVKFIRKQTKANSIFDNLDIKWIHWSKKNKIDGIIVPLVKHHQDVKEVKELLYPDSSIKVFAKLQTPMCLDDFEAILDESDGVVISRNYLNLYLDKTKYYNIQKDIIQKCQLKCKPVYVVGSILSSMCTGRFPTSVEINDLSALIEEKIDGVFLVKEVGLKYRIDAIKIAAGICCNSQEAAEKIKCKKKLMMKEEDSLASKLFPRQELLTLIENCLKHLKNSLIYIDIDDQELIRALDKRYQNNSKFLVPNKFSSRFLAFFRGVYIIDFSMSDLKASESIPENVIARGFIEKNQVLAYFSADANRGIYFKIVPYLNQTKVKKKIFNKLI